MAAAVIGWESSRENVSGVAIAAAPRPSQTVPEVRAPPLTAQFASKTDTKNDRETPLRIVFEGEYCTRVKGRGTRYLRNGVGRLVARPIRL